MHSKHFHDSNETHQFSSIQADSWAQLTILAENGPW